MTMDRVSGGGLVLLGVFVAFERRVLPLGTHGQPGPGYFPLILSLLLILFGAILILRGGLSAAFRSVSWSEAPHAVAILGTCVFTTLVMERIGYRVTMFAALGFLFGVIERLKLWYAIVLTLGLSLGSFWLFDSMLRVPLPRGAWGF